MKKNEVVGHLPDKRDLILDYVLSLISTFLMTAISLGGLLYPATFYPTDELLQSYITRAR